MQAYIDKLSSDLVERYKLYIATLMAIGTHGYETIDVGAATVRGAFGERTAWMYSGKIPATSIDLMQNQQVAPIASDQQVSRPIMLG